MIFLEKINDIGVVEYLCNTEEDLRNINIQDIRPGSIAHIITPKKDYILDEDKTWVEYIKSGEQKKEEEKETILCLDKYHIKNMWFDNLRHTEYDYFEHSIYIVPRNLKELKIAIDEYTFPLIHSLKVWDNDDNLICNIQNDEFEEYTNEWRVTYYIYTFTEEDLERILQYKIVGFECYAPPQ